MPTSAVTGTKHSKAAGASDADIKKAQKEAAEAQKEAAEANERAEQAEKNAQANPQGVDLEEARPVERSDYYPDDPELQERGKTFDDDVHRTRVRQLDDGTSITEALRFGSNEWEQVDAVKVYPKAVYPVDVQNPPQPNQDDPEAYT
jgi:hypothetical protein